MNGPYQGTTVGFGERAQEPLEDIPTDPERFLQWGTTLDRHHPYKYELSNGKVSCMMIQVSRAHWLVTANILEHLLPRLDKNRFQGGHSEFGVRTGVGVRYPDIVVDRVSSGLGGLACEAPILVVEVLSSSTAGLDFTVKLKEYKAIGSLQTYLISAQDEPRAWVWVRQGDGSWPELPVEFVGRNDSVALGGLDVELSMAAMFRGIPDPPPLE